jgi:hypothetical protein
MLEKAKCWSVCRQICAGDEMCAAGCKKGQRREGLQEAYRAGQALEYVRAGGCGLIPFLQVQVFRCVQQGARREREGKDGFQEAYRAGQVLEYVQAGRCGCSDGSKSHDGWLVTSTLK